MNDTFSSSARPPGTAVAWATKTEILVEIPCAGLPPYVVRYKKTVEGLASALNVLMEHPSPKKMDFSHPKVKTVQNFSQDDREKARQILKKMGIT